MRQLHSFIYIYIMLIYIYMYIYICYIYDVLFLLYSVVYSAIEVVLEINVFGPLSGACAFPKSNKKHTMEPCQNVC